MTLVFVALLCAAISTHVANKNSETIILVLKEGWDDAVSWDQCGSTRTNLPNPSSSVFGELLVGDASTYYGLSDLRTYFRFAIPDAIRNGVILSARLSVHCSAGGNDIPKLSVRYIDLQNIPSLKDTGLRQLPISKSFVRWQNDNWHWKSGWKYQTPDIQNLLREYFQKHGDSQEFVVVICNNGTDAFKGISSFDDDHAHSARLVVTYR